MYCKSAFFAFYRIGVRNVLFRARRKFLRKPCFSRLKSWFSQEFASDGNAATPEMLIIILNATPTSPKVAFRIGNRQINRAMFFRPAMWIDVHADGVRTRLFIHKKENITNGINRFHMI